MKIIYIHPANPSSHKANIIQTLSVCKAMSDLGHNITIYYSDKWTKSDSIFYNFQDINFKIKYVKINILLNKGKILRTIGLSILGLVGSLNGILSKVDFIYTRDPILGIISLFIGNKIIFEEHAYSNARYSRFFRNIIYKNRKLIKVVYISDALRNLYDNNKLYVKPLKQIVYHDSTFPQDLRRKQRNQFQKIAYFGTLETGRGIEIINALAKEFQFYKFSIYGKVQNYDLIQTITKSKNIIIHGEVSRSEIFKCMIENDLLLMPYEKKSLSTGLNSYMWMSPLKMFEYMATGVPILASDLSVLREVLSDENAYFADPNSIDSWVIQVKYISKDNSRFIKANNAKELINTKYNWHKRMKIILEY